MDRDYADDVAIFYSRSLRSYPNHCQRLHFFQGSITEEGFAHLMARANSGEIGKCQQTLQDGYLGFSVVKPLPGCPVGRTVLVTLSGRAMDGSERRFSPLRRYDVNLAVFQLNVHGLAFQQQDQGVSACATTALWTALHRVAPMEGLLLPTPASITQSASRYVLAGGRSLPSDGLTSHQMCEAIRAAGLSPLVISSVDPENDKAEIGTYLDSGFPVVLALQPLSGQDGHAVCVVGQKIGTLPPRADGSILFNEASRAVKAYYVHDDRLGPYAVADVQPFTLALKGGSKTVTTLEIRWRSREVWETSILKAAIVPVPVKLRLTATRMRNMGILLAQWAGTQVAPSLAGQIQLSCRFLTAPELKRNSLAYGLSNAGLRRLTTNTTFSRYVGLIEIGAPTAPLFSVVLDATETTPNPSVIACIRRSPSLTAAAPLELLAEELGAKKLVE